MDGPRGHHTKGGKSEKDKCHMISLIHRTLKNATNEATFQTETDSQAYKTNLWLPKGKG